MKGYRPALVIIEGPSGSGKTTIGNYLRDELGYAWDSSDRIMLDVLAKPAGLRLRDVARVMGLRRGDFWERFWKDRGSPNPLGYTPEDAYREIIEPGKEAIKKGLAPCAEAQYRIFYSMIGSHVSRRDAALKEGQDFVLDGAIFSEAMRENLLDPAHLPVPARGYALRLMTTLGEAARRNSELKGWEPKLARERSSVSLDGANITVPEGILSEVKELMEREGAWRVETTMADKDYSWLFYRNEDPDDLSRIKGDLKGLSRRG